MPTALGWRRSEDTAGAIAIVRDRFRASVYGQVQLVTSQDFYFDSDSIRLRATFRFGAKIADVERVVKLAVTDLGS
jgi:hypothetical protein